MHPFLRSSQTPSLPSLTESDRYCCQTHKICLMHDQFKIPAAQWPDESKVADALASQIMAAMTRQSGAGGEVRHSIPPNVVKGMADIATHIWKAKCKMVDSGTGEVRDDMKRVFRHVDGALETLSHLGLELKDHTGDAFDYGMPLKVVTNQQTEGITRETVIETLRPTIYWQKQIIQHGEVVIGTPTSPPSIP